MKIFKIRLLSFMLILSLTLSMSVPAFAYSRNVSDEGIIKDDISYVDSDGKTCVVEITINEKNNTVTAKSHESQSVFNLDTKKVTTRYSNGTSEVEKFNLPAEPVQSVSIQSSLSRTSSTYIGTVKYKPYLDPYLGSITDSLKIYSTNNGTVKDEYVINGEQYDTASKIIGFFVSALVGWGVGKAAPAIADKIWNGLISGGIVIVGSGALKAAFTTTVTAQNTYYDLKAIDPKTKNSKTYEGSMHRVISKGANFDKVYYNGCYPQFLAKKDNTVAYWLFSDFFAYSYPGVKSY